MSDQPTLYRANPSPIEGEEDAIERLAAFRAIVPVEPVATLTVSYDDGPFYVGGDVGELPYGTYAIVRLDDE